MASSPTPSRSEPRPSPPPAQTSSTNTNSNQRRDRQRDIRTCPAWTTSYSNNPHHFVRDFAAYAIPLAFGSLASSAPLRQPKKRGFWLLGGFRDFIINYTEYEIDRQLRGGLPNLEVERRHGKPVQDLRGVVFRTEKWYKHATEMVAHEVEKEIRKWVRNHIAWYDRPPNYPKGVQPAHEEEHLASGALRDTAAPVRPALRWGDLDGEQKEFLEAALTKRLARTIGEHAREILQRVDEANGSLWGLGHDDLVEMTVARDFDLDRVSIGAGDHFTSADQHKVALDHPYTPAVSTTSSTTGASPAYSSKAQTPPRRREQRGDLVGDKGKKPPGVRDIDPSGSSGGKGKSPQSSHTPPQKPNLQHKNANSIEQTSSPANIARQPISNPPVPATPSPLPKPQEPLSTPISARSAQQPSVQLRPAPAVPSVTAPQKPPAPSPVISPAPPTQSTVGRPSNAQPPSLQGSHPSPSKIIQKPSSSILTSTPLAEHTSKQSPHGTRLTPPGSTHGPTPPSLRPNPPNVITDKRPQQMIPPPAPSVDHKAVPPSFAPKPANASTSKPAPPLPVEMSAAAMSQHSRKLAKGSGRKVWPLTVTPSKAPQSPASVEKKDPSPVPPASKTQTNHDSSPLRVDPVKAAALRREKAAQAASASTSGPSSSSRSQQPAAPARFPSLANKGKPPVVNNHFATNSSRPVTPNPPFIDPNSPTFIIYRPDPALVPPLDLRAPTARIIAKDKLGVWKATKAGPVTGKSAGTESRAEGGAWTWEDSGSGGSGSSSRPQGGGHSSSSQAQPPMRTPPSQPPSRAPPSQPPMRTPPSQPPSRVAPVPTSRPPQLQPNVQPTAPVAPRRQQTSSTRPSVAASTTGPSQRPPATGSSSSRNDTGIQFDYDKGELPTWKWPKGS